jgi:hypothetical protein
MRLPLPDQEVLLPLAFEKWDQFIQSLYCNHVTYHMTNAYKQPRQWLNQMAFDGRLDGYLMEEAKHLYPDPASLFPLPLRPEGAREMMAREAAREALKKCPERNTQSDET